MRITLVEAVQSAVESQQPARCQHASTMTIHVWRSNTQVRACKAGTRTCAALGLLRDQLSDGEVRVAGGVGLALLALLRLPARSRDWVCAASAAHVLQGDCTTACTKYQAFCIASQVN